MSSLHFDFHSLCIMHRHNTACNCIYGPKAGDGSISVNIFLFFLPGFRLCRYYSTSCPKFQRQPARTIPFQAELPHLTKREKGGEYEEKELSTDTYRLCCPINVQYKQDKFCRFSTFFGKRIIFSGFGPFFPRFRRKAGGNKNKRENRTRFSRFVYHERSLIFIPCPSFLFPGLSCTGSWRCKHRRWPRSASSSSL